MALPPGMMAKAVEGLQALKERGIGYPIMYLGPLCDPSPVLTHHLPRLVGPSLTSDTSGLPLVSASKKQD